MWKVKRLLEVCDKWNLSISVAKRFWGRRKVEYLGHQISIAGLEANPKKPGIIGEHPVPSHTASDAVIFGKPQLLQ